MNNKPTKTSKQIGRTVSNLIGIARSLKAVDEGRPAHTSAASQEKDMHTEADRVKYWRGIAKKNADMVKQKDIELEVIKRMKVQNLSLGEIERELLRRAKLREQQGNTHPQTWPK